MPTYLKFSVLTPSLNQGTFIEDNIRSVLDQKYPNFEQIIMDGGSTDNTVEILRRYPHLIWKSEPDKGQSNALNKAFKIATGDIICWLNSDDLLCAGAFYSVNEFFVRNGDKHCVIGGLQHVNEQGGLVYERAATEVNYEGLLNQGQCVQQMSTFFRKEVFDEVGLLDESYHYAMDHEFWLRVARQFKFYTIEKDLAKFRRYKGSKTGSGEMRFVKEIMRMRAIYGGRWSSISNLRMVMMYAKQPLKRIVPIRTLVRRLKGKRKEFWY